VVSPNVLVSSKPAHLAQDLFACGASHHYKWIMEAPAGATPMVAKAAASDKVDTAPALQLSGVDVRQQLRLIRTGLLGSGATAHVYACVWPDRFGETKLLAAKVIEAMRVKENLNSEDQEWRGLDWCKDSRNSACTLSFGDYCVCVDKA
jgi:hypothetical protein